MELEEVLTAVNANAERASREMGDIINHNPVARARKRGEWLAYTDVQVMLAKVVCRAPELPEATRLTFGDEPFFNRAGVIPTTLASYQELVATWMRSVFEEDPRDTAPAERCMRVLEEAAELAQSIGLTREQVVSVVNYVFRRPKGEPSQEVAGVVVTLLGLCAAMSINAEAELSKELVRVNTPEMRQKIRERQAEKRKAMVTAEYDSEPGAFNFDD